jgi:hypothetical protein
MAAGHGHGHGHGHAHVGAWRLLGHSARVRHTDASAPVAYKVGDVARLQCVQQNGEWGPAPRCTEVCRARCWPCRRAARAELTTPWAQTGDELQVVVGRDAPYLCTWQLDAAQYAYVRMLLASERASCGAGPGAPAARGRWLTVEVAVACAGGWACRVPMTNDPHSFRIPLTLPLWGVAEAAHVHVDNHINLVFHLDDGWIIGAAAYPSTRGAVGRSMACVLTRAVALVRERFEEATETGRIHVHGETRCGRARACPACRATLTAASCRWFRFQGFEPLVGASGVLPGRPLVALVARHPVWSGIVTMMATCLAVAVVFLVVYRLCLRPRLLRDAAAAADPRPPAKDDGALRVGATPL